MRRLPVLCLAAASLLAGCSSVATTDSVVVAIPPGSTEPVPGSCDPIAEALPAPSVGIDGTGTLTTFGIGNYECGTITGDGYILFSFNPVLLDADAAITVHINSAATAELSWSLGEPFTQTGSQVWKSATPRQGCARLTIALTSPAGKNTATYGADIRVGGAGIDCPQRVIDPTDPGLIGSIPINTPAPVNSVPPPPRSDLPTSTSTRTTS